MSIRPHKKLEAWKESIALVKMIYQEVKLFPESEKFGLSSQIKRASVSIPVNIAEGATRNSKKEFLYFLGISLGSLSEVDALIEISYELEFINHETFEKCSTQINKVSAIVNGLKNLLSNPSLNLLIS